MKIKIIDYGYQKAPTRFHDWDAGADVYAPTGFSLAARSTGVLPLGFGLDIPNGYVGFICPRSSWSQSGVVSELAPIDAGYNGMIYAIITNHRDEPLYIAPGERVGQLVILPCVIADFVEDAGEARGTDGFGSTGA